MAMWHNGPIFDQPVRQMNGCGRYVYTIAQGSGLWGIAVLVSLASEFKIGPALNEIFKQGQSEQSGKKIRQ